MLTHGHPLVSFKMSPFRCRWLSYVLFMCLSLFIVVWSRALIKDKILFLRISWQSRSCLPLSTQVYATLGMIMVRSSSCLVYKYDGSIINNALCFFPCRKKVTFQSSYTETGGKRGKSPIWFQIYICFYA